MGLTDIIKDEKTIKIIIQKKEHELYESQYSALIKILEETETNLNEINCTYLGKYFGVGIDNKKIISLQIKNYGITAMPEAITSLTQLTVLYLNNNKLTSLPESIGNLTQLTKLYLWNNQLTSLPKSMGNLTQLTKLDASQNQLISLPESIKKNKGIMECLNDESCFNYFYYSARDYFNKKEYIEKARGALFNNPGMTPESIKELLQKNIDSVQQLFTNDMLELLLQKKQELKKEDFRQYYKTIKLDNKEESKRIIIL